MREDLEHDTLEEGATKLGKAAQPKATPKRPKLRDTRREVKHRYKRIDPNTHAEKPWCAEDNPAIWEGDVSDLYDDIEVEDKT